MKKDRVLAIVSISLAVIFFISTLIVLNRQDRKVEQCTEYWKNTIVGQVFPAKSDFEGLDFTAKVTSFESELEKGSCFITEVNASVEIKPAGCQISYEELFIGGIKIGCLNHETKWVENLHFVYEGKDIPINPTSVKIVP